MAPMSEPTDAAGSARSARASGPLRPSRSTASTRPAGYVAAAARRRTARSRRTDTRAAPASYPQQPPGRQRKTWDLVLTIVLLVMGLFGAGIGVIYGFAVH